MITGSYVKCSNCNHAYRIRYNVGNNFPQSASFFCKTCRLPITYGYDPDRKRVFENIEIVDETPSAQIINLHPELTIEEDKESDPTYFPSVEFMARNMVAGKDMLNLREVQANNVAYIHEWDGISEDYRLLEEEIWPMLKKSYGDDVEVLKIPIASNISK